MEQLQSGVPCSFSPGGPIAYLRDGDLIEYDIPNRTLRLVGTQDGELTPEQAQAVLEERKRTQPLKPPAVRKGLLKRYTESAASAMKGAGI